MSQQSELNIRTSAFLGDIVMGTALIQNIKSYFPTHALNVYTKHPSLLEGLSEADNVRDAKTDRADHYDVDLLDYVENNDPQNLDPKNSGRPLKHLLAWQTEIAAGQLGVPLLETMDDFKLKVNLTSEEIRFARELAGRLADGKPLVWLQTKSSTAHKDWTPEGWLGLETALPNVTFVDLTKINQPPRISMAITKFCDAGVTLDSFLLHGSQAVAAPNVLTLMMSSSPEVVCYPNQKVIKARENGVELPDVVREVSSLLARDAQHMMGPGMRRQNPAVFFPRDS